VLRAFLEGWMMLRCLTAGALLLVMTWAAGCGSDTSGGGGSGTSSEAASDAAASTTGNGGASSTAASTGSGSGCSLPMCTSTAANECAFQPCMSTAEGKNYCYPQAATEAECAAGSTATMATVDGMQRILCVPDGCPAPTMYVP